MIDDREVIASMNVMMTAIARAVKVRNSKVPIMLLKVMSGPCFTSNPSSCQIENCLKIIGDNINNINKSNNHNNDRGQ